MTRGKRLAFIIHGARADQPALRKLVDWVRERGHTVIPYVTWEKGDGRRLARDAASHDADVVIAAGGDGTVNEVVNGLDGLDVPMGIIPIGTANDFARQVGIPLDADHAMDVILRRKPVRIDTAEINGRRFLNVSSGGIGAEATASTPVETKEALGPLAYAVIGLRKLAQLHPWSARFTGDGFELNEKFVVFAVGNARATGGGQLITPRARVRDGLLDVVIVGEMPRAELARVALRIKKGEHLEHEQVRYYQTAWITIEAKKPLMVNVDGEPIEEKRLEYRARQGDLRIFLANLPGGEERRSPREASAAD